MVCDVFLVLAFPLWKIVNCLQNLSEGWLNASPQLNQSALCSGRKKGRTGQLISQF